MREYGDFEDLKNLLLYKRIVKWDSDTLTLEDGTVVSVEESEYDCCANAYGEFREVELDAVITAVSDPLVTDIPDDDTRINAGIVTIYHNQNIVALADCYANAGNGGYYYSICSLVVDDVHYKVVEV
ncbi:MULTISPECIES: DUF7448 domain-containing protein [Enterococcus]|uniref:DUF7448 domain-containing protein n=1 Tax=Enterococcus TaxID=1350 RepID=UPI000B648915|nr:MULTISPECIES: hypothetical protein [Enterococcus]OTO15139.1 hypothetical protein A5875_004296 [Enterococcus sp. 3H8_DIV0648]